MPLPSSSAIRRYIMAAKKTTDAPEVAVTETETTDVPVVKNPERSYVTTDNTEKYEVTLPVDSGEGDKVVWVNDRKYTIARGKKVKVPAWVYEVLQQEEKMALQEYEYKQKNQDRFKQF